jgi:hypothetical protein
VIGEQERLVIFRVAAIASFASALTTAVLIYGPGAEAGSGLVEQAELYDDWRYLYKRWVLFFHPQFAFIASLGVAVALFTRHPVLVSLGLFYLLVWAVTEMTQQAFIIDALNAYYRPGLLGAGSEAERIAYETLITGFEGITDSQYFVLLFGFGVGTMLYGWAFLAADGFGSAIGIVLLFLGLVSLLAFMGYYMGASSVAPLSAWVYANLYGVLQTGVRIAMGAWLWQRATR